MAKETKAEKLARLEREHLKRAQEAAAEYPARVMRALADANRMGFEMFVNSDLEFVVQNRDAHTLQEFTFTQEWSNENEAELVDLEWAVSREMAAREEAKRKLQVRAAALAKLTEEERKELGLQ